MTLDVCLVDSGLMIQEAASPVTDFSSILGSCLGAETRELKV